MTQITLQTLDDALTMAKVNAADVALIWMDTQGHEGKVLEGAPRLLERPVPMVMEFWPAGIQESGTEIVDLLERLTRRYRGYYDLHQGAPKREAMGSLPRLAEKLSRISGYTDLVLIPN